MNLNQADEQVRMVKAGIHHRKFSFHHGRNNIGMIVLRKPFQLVSGLNLTCASHKFAKGVKVAFLSTSYLKVK